MLNKKELSKQLETKNPLGKMLKDNDGDKVANVLDCEPNNKNKQGLVHDIKARFKNKVKDYYKENAQRYHAERAIKKKETAAYYRAREKESLKFAEERAKYEREQKLKKLKEPSKGFFGSFTATAPKKIKTVTPRKRKTTKRKTTKRKTTKRKTTTKSRYKFNLNL